jgi:hypothetical protein
VTISKPKRPALVCAGTVLTVAPNTRYDEAAKKYTDEVTGYTLSLSQESGAVFDVKVGLDRQGDLTIPLPNVLERVALVVDVTESKEWGASLRASRYVGEDDLDRIHSMVLATASASK